MTTDELIADYAARATALLDDAIEQTDEALDAMLAALDEPPANARELRPYIYGEED